MENIVKFDNVSFKYDESKKILDNFNLEIKKGKYTVIIGPNGSGKSTIAKLIDGLYEVNEGSIYVDNLKINEDNIYQIRNKLAIVFQNPDNQFIGSTVEDDIAFGLENRKVDPDKMKDIIIEYATYVGMQDFIHAEPTLLSGGQKQRVAIAGALALNPELLILDEATAMLDSKGRKEILELILKLKEKNISIISITHNIEEALQADEIIILNKGKLIKQDIPNNVLFNYDLLTNNNVCPPFVISLYHKLKENGINVDESLSLDGLIEKL